MKEKPLVSVVLATCNREKYIKKAIESVLNQTYKNIELIVVDDRSTDNTSKIISNFKQKDQRIVILTNEINLGQVKSLNKGIKKSKGKYIARIDDDDFWCDFKKLEKQINFLENHQDYILVGGGIIIINEKQKEILRYLHPEKDEEIKKRMLFCTQFAHSAVVFRKDAYNSVGGYNKDLNYSEDWDLWLKLGKVGKLYNFQDYFLSYLKGSQRKTSYWKNEIKYNSELRRKYRRDYPNYYKAVLFGFISTIYYSLPFVRKILHPLSAKFREKFLNILTASFKTFKKE